MANRKMESAEKLTIEEWRIAHKIPMGNPLWIVCPQGLEAGENGHGNRV